MKSDVDLIAEAKRDGIPSIAFARKIEKLRRDYLRTVTEVAREEVKAELEDTYRLAYSYKRLRWLIVLANAIFGLTAFFAYAFVVLQGYRSFVAPIFGLPNIGMFDVVMVLLVVKYAWKGYSSIERVKKLEEKFEQEKQLLWLDRTKEVANANAHNLGGAGMVALLFYLVTWFS